MAFTLHTPRMLLLAMLAASSWAMCASAAAQVVGDVPEDLQGVGVDEKRGEQVPLGLAFRDDKGAAVTLADIFDGERPVLLSLNYSGCPMLCRVQLNGLVDCLKDMEWTTGQEFDVVSVSIDPRETTEQARLTKKLYVEEYGRTGAADGWRFLTGDEQSIRQLADAVGFRYKYVERTQEYAHTAVIMVCSQDGMISRYLDGVLFEPQTVRLALVEASEGKVGSAIDRFLLSCYVYDHTSGKYGPTARTLMSAGAAATVLVLGLTLFPYWFLKSAQQDGAEASASRHAAEDRSRPPDPQTAVA
ncbi:MAG: SCO family protein [Planctomycetota bacterium]